jgi:hypothetical protein
MTTEPTDERREPTALADAVRQTGVSDPRVIEAFRRVVRSRFVPVEAASLANADEPIPIGHEQVTTQPSLVARMVDALELAGDERVLEIGTGLGYQAAILGTLAREVYSIERLPDLAVQARHNLRAAGLDNVDVLVGDGIDVARLLTLHHVLLALTVIASISVVGIVLVNALLVIPAATAKLLARSLGQMFVLAPVLGIGSVLAGLTVSAWVDAPSGPAIVVIAGILFLAAWGRAARRARRRSGRTGA